MKYLLAIALLCLSSTADARHRVVTTKTYTEAICPDCGLPLSRHAMRRLPAMQLLPQPNQFQEGPAVPQYRVWTRVKVR